MNWRALLFSFSGRINRTRYWLCLLVFCACLLTAAVIAFVPESDFAMILILPPYWIYFAATVKRLHDLDRSGWWSIALFFIPVGVVILGIIPGTPGMNRYGADPQLTLQTA